MTKKDKLDKLDEFILDRMLEVMASKDEDMIATLSDLSVPMNYLKNNSVVSEKAKSTVEQDTEARLKAAKERRKANQPK